MATTFEANLQRLSEFETLEGKPKPAAEKEAGDLRLSYEKGSLQHKDKVIEKVINRKANLALPHLSEIIRLRQIIERGMNLQSEEMERDEGDHKAVLQDEIDWIDELLVAKIRSKTGDYGYNPGGTTEEMRNIVAGLAQAYEDPSLLQTFQRVRLLRTTSDFFYL